MSGRDFRTFLASHQAEIGKDSHLVTRFLSGRKPTYKKNDYEQLYALTKIKKSSGDRALQRIESLAKQGKHDKDRQLLLEHKHVWEKEMHNLIKQQEKIEHDLVLLRPSTPNFQQSTTSIEALYEDIVDIEDCLRIEFKKFMNDTLQPVLNLTDDIKKWISDNRAELVTGIHDDEKENDISEVMVSVKKQHNVLLEKLEADANEMERDFSQTINEIGINTYNMNLPQITVGVPVCVLKLKCPDESLLHSFVKNFDDLDEHYMCNIELLEEKYDSVIRRCPFHGWSELDHLHFKHIMNQYKNITKNRRKLYLDRLTKELPHKTREQLVTYEGWWSQYKSFQAQLKGLFDAWKRDKEDLELKVTWLSQEACRHYYERNKKLCDHMKQKFVCNYLHEKLLEYRNEQFELLKLEAEQRFQQEQEDERKKKLKETKEKHKRKLDKEQIQIYKESQERILTRQKEYDEQRMMELQQRRAEERAYDIERVEYRATLHSEKLDQKKEQQVQVERANLEKERRLQKLRLHVMENVENDPTRVFQPTEAYKAHLAAVYDEEKDAQTPLFNLYTYSVDQVAQDKRLKIENALRRANLHMTEYGRSVLSNIAPPSQPRKDMLSTTFQ